MSHYANSPFSREKLETFRPGDLCRDDSWALANNVYLVVRVQRNRHFIIEDPADHEFHLVTVQKSGELNTVLLAYALKHWSIIS
jgi:hypothetical protein